MDLILTILGGSCGAALISGAVALIQLALNRRDRKQGLEDVQSKALRYLMLYIIQERASQHLRAGSVTLEERRSLHHWHRLYHDGLGGNGDADVLMAQLDRLPLTETEGTVWN